MYINNQLEDMPEWFVNYVHSGASDSGASDCVGVQQPDVFERQELARNQSTTNNGTRSSLVVDMPETGDRRMFIIKKPQNVDSSLFEDEGIPPSDDSNKGAISLAVGLIIGAAFAYLYNDSNIKKLNKDIVDLKAKVDELHTTNKRSEKELKSKIKEITELTEQLRQSDGKNKELKVKLFEAQQSLCQIIKNNPKFKKLEKTSAYRASVRMTDSMVTTVSENFKKLTSGLSSLFTRRSGGAAACGNTSRRSRNTGGTRKRRR